MLPDLPHIGGIVCGCPLMINQPKLDTILDVLTLRLDGGTIDPTPESDCPFSITPNGIAIVSALGTLTNRTFGASALSGLASYKSIADQIDRCASDPAIKGALLDLDSQGGQAGGAFDLLDKIMSLRGVKPVYAIANETCLSAAYALACGAERIYVTQTGAVGSIGVVAVHVDQSGADEKAGVRYDYITAGDRKAETNPHAPLTNKARAALQAEVDRLYGLFVGKVAQARGLSDTQVRDQQAGIFYGENAIAAGLADQIGTISSALSDLSARIASPAVRLSSPTSSRGLIMTQTNSPPLEANTNLGPSPVQALREQLASEIEAKASGASTSSEAPEKMAARLREEAATIHELCQIAGSPALAPDYIRQGLSPASVRKALLAARAETFESAPIAPVETASAAGPNPLIAAIRASLKKDA